MGSKPGAGKPVATAARRSRGCCTPPAPESAPALAPALIKGGRPSSDGRHRPPGRLAGDGRRGCGSSAGPGRGSPGSRPPAGRSEERGALMAAGRCPRACRGAARSTAGRCPRSPRCRPVSIKGAHAGGRRPPRDGAARPLGWAREPAAAALAAAGSREVRPAEPDRLGRQVRLSAVSGNAGPGRAGRRRWVPVAGGGGSAELGRLCRAGAVGWSPAGAAHGRA